MPPTATAKRVKRSSKSPAAGALHGTGPGGVALQGPGPGGPLSTTTVQTVESAVMEDDPSVVRSVLRANHHMMKCMWPKFDVKICTIKQTTCMVFNGSAIAFGWTILV